MCSPTLAKKEGLRLAWSTGRIDHFGFDPGHNRLFVSALGSNTEEIIGIGAQTVVHTISGVPTPQGVAYSSPLELT
jgi:hypothetical protein